jgi:DNA-dependent protein kinase catalytic subunit
VAPQGGSPRTVPHLPRHYCFFKPQLHRFFSFSRQKVTQILPLELKKRLGISQYAYFKKFDQQPKPEEFIKVAAFGSDVSVFSSIKKPIKITMIGDDGKNYDYIVKCGEDLRQDERIQQIFAICNGFFDGMTSSKMITYDVVPISSKLGLIQFVAKTTTFKSLTKGAISPRADLIVDPKKDPKSFKSSLKTSNEEKKLAFKDMVLNDLKGCQEFKNAYQKMSSSPEGFFFLRNNFIISHAQV